MFNDEKDHLKDKQMYRLTTGKRKPSTIGPIDLALFPRGCFIAHDELLVLPRRGFERLEIPARRAQGAGIAQGLHFVEEPDCRQLIMGMAFLEIGWKRSIFNFGAGRRFWKSSCWREIFHTVFWYIWRAEQWFERITLRLVTV